ncbi:MAG: hypothetical protein LUH22_14735 [Bacteroides sp.]|nr:hypothetical protein [Bacteroides sp.]
MNDEWGNMDARSVQAVQPLASLHHSSFITHHSPHGSPKYLTIISTCRGGYIRGWRSLRPSPGVGPRAGGSSVSIG